MTAQYDYGVLGVGEIGEAIVTGLCDGVAEAPRILLSPRSRDRSVALAGRYPSVSVAPDNQSLVERCPVVVLCIRPPDAPAVLARLTFRPEQAVVSVLAGVSLPTLGQLVAPAQEVARAIPLPSVSRRASVTPIHPDAEAARRLFDRLGGAAAVDAAAAFEAMSAATATVVAHLRYLSTISRWLSDRGVARAQASLYVSSLFAGVSHELPTEDLERLARAYATPGGINERFAGMLDEAGVFGVVDRSLERVYDRLRS